MCVILIKIVLLCTKWTELKLILLLITYTSIYYNTFTIQSTAVSTRQDVV